MPRNSDDESKEEQKSHLGDVDGQDELHPVVVAFVGFSYSTSLSAKAEEFIRLHAREAGFQNKKKLEETGEGHPMAWSALHSDYCASIETELTTFSKQVR